MSTAVLYLSLGIAALAVSWAAIFIRLANADPISTAFYRMLFASLLLVIPATKGVGAALRSLPAQDRRRLVLSGIVLGLHFAAWITSLKYTTISNSVIIVATQPFFVAAFEALILKEKLSRRAVWGMVLAFAGMVLIAGADFHLRTEYLWGDFLALLGALFAGTYLFLGRRVRAVLDNRHYILPVYFLAAVTLAAIGVLSSSPYSGFPARTWVYFFLLALIPTIVGHTMYNYLLKFVRAHLVAVTILGEPIGATIFAALIFREFPPATTYIGGILILGGIFTALYKSSRVEPPVEMA